MGKVCVNLGTFGDGTPFTDLEVEDLAKMLQETGMERYGNDILYNPRTGEQMPTMIFMGPTYYQRLKHMVSDKIHCLTLDHEVLTADGWKYYPQLTMDDQIATLKDGNLVYEKPLDLLYFPNYDGKMYHISNQGIDLDVTANHRMWVSTCTTRKRVWSDYKFMTAEEVMGKHVKYSKHAKWDVPDYQFVLPEYGSGQRYHESKYIDMDSWLTFFGIWYAEGWTCTYTNAKGYKTKSIQISVNKQRVKDALYPALKKMGYNFNVINEKLYINNVQLYTYMQQLSVGAPNKEMPEWVMNLSANQSQKLVQAMQLGDGSFSKRTTSSVYYTSSKRLADQVMQLCLHAGWAANIQVHSKAGNTVSIHGRQVVSQYDVLRVAIIKHRTEPQVNHGHVHEQNVQKEFMYDYKGDVFCLQVSSEVFMVRRNGKAVWTGNSRSSNGPVVLLTRQPAEGRAREGGLRMGEMEVECNWGHGTLQFLKERLMDCSDNYRVFVCNKCGIMSNVNPEKNKYECKSCKNNTNFAQLRIPYACKLLFQEIQCMGIGTKFITQ